MKRFVLCICIGGLLTATSAPGAFGFAGNFDYVGHVKGEPSAFVGFFVEHGPAGHRKVTRFTVSQVPYHCNDLNVPDGVTTGWSFDPKMRVKPDRTFFEAGQWTGLPLDPQGLVKGKLRRGGVAAGSFKLNGELAGPGTHCHTTLLEWRAAKQQPPA